VRGTGRSITAGLLDERNDAHGAGVAGTHERIHFVDLRAEAGPRPPSPPLA